MKWARYRNRDAAVGLGVVSGELIHELDGPADLTSLLGDDGQRLREAGQDALRHPRRVLELTAAELMAPLDPPTVRDFYAFEQHVRAGRSWRGLEMDPDWYELPVFYFSNPYAVTGPGDVRIAPGSSAFDFELEVAAVVGRGGADVPPEQGDDLIAGYLVMNDWSARDLQQREMKLSLGPVKGKDTATSLGPYFVTKDEIEDRRSGPGYDLAMTCSVNGRPYTAAVWSDVYWSMAEMVTYASRGTEVRPGDVIGSGTCPTGCILELSQAAGHEQFPWLHAGDIVEAAVEGLGTLRNRIAVAGPVIALRGIGADQLAHQ